MRGVRIDKGDKNAASQGLERECGESRSQCYGRRMCVVKNEPIRPA